MTTIFMKTSVKNGVITTLCFGGTTYETCTTDKYGKITKSFQVNDIKKARKNHQRLVELVAR